MTDILEVSITDTVVVEVETADGIVLEVITAGPQGAPGVAGAGLSYGAGFKIVGAELRYDFQSLVRG